MLGSVSLGIIMLVVLMVTLTTRSLPISVTGSLPDVYNSRKRCIRPEECCKFPRSSEEFVQCSADHGCYPISCDGLHDIGNAADNGNCKEAGVCCRFLQQSPEFLQCCADHNCCPLCDKVSKGCCYNQRMYWWGSVVEELPELCVELVCAAQVSNTRPLLTALILPVRSHAHHCQGMWCGDHLTFYCVDYTGLIKTEGAKWQSDECHQCQCRGGNVTCHKQEIQCPPSPHSSCIEIPCTCCPRWNCPASLVEPMGLNDSSNIALRSGYAEHHLGQRKWSIWKPLQGFTHYLSSLHGKITAVHNTGGCQELGKTWPTSDPCSKSVCTRTGIQITRETCSDVVPLHPNCLQFTPKEDCCPKWNCSGCFKDGNYYKLGSEISTKDPCITLLCTNGGFERKIKLCSSTPAPRDNCFQYIPEGECCKKWNCSGCFKDGINYKLGSEISTKDPCITLQCTNGGFERKIKLCSSTPAPRDNCFQYIPEGECCKKWNCSGCFDAGKFYPLHHKWTSTPCVTYECTSDGLQKTEKHCYIIPAPHNGCKEIVPEGGCCPEWSCSQCYKDGNYYDLGSETVTKNPCITLKCTVSGIEMKYKSCFGTPAPAKNCFEYKTEKDCCEKWNCSGCVDKLGGYYALWEPRKIDPCTTLVCTTDGIKPIVQSCYLAPRPHQSCHKTTPEGVCCPQWDCGA